MRRKPTYQELANATLAKTKLGAVTQPYVPYNDNALEVKELRTMTDRLALEKVRTYTPEPPTPRPIVTHQDFMRYIAMHSQTSKQLQREHWRNLVRF